MVAKSSAITLLLKHNRPREFTKNLRPMSLLNIPFEVISGCIANKIKNSLDTIIHGTQRKFVAGRSLSENTGILHDGIHYTKEHSIPDFLVIDFENVV